MKTKTSLLAALVALAGTASLTAQVYSLNVVGYVNLNVPAGYSLVANQMVSSNMTIGALIPNPPPATQVYKWTGSGFDSYEYFDGLGWLPDGNATMNPGEGAFINNQSGSAITLTLVGEVSQGSLTNNLPSGYSVRSSIVPQQGDLDSMNFPAAPGDQVYKWTGAGYDSYEYFDGLGWLPGAPVLNVGEAVFVNKTASASWVRSFTVN